MLDPQKLDLGEIAAAMEDSSYESSSWMDPETDAGHGAGLTGIRGLVTEEAADAARGAGPDTGLRPAVLPHRRVRVASVPNR